MKLSMKASARMLTMQGLALLLKQTKAASREAGKAFLPTAPAGEQLGRIGTAVEILPVSEEASAVWDAPDAIVLTYRDALFMVAIELNKTLKREKEFRNDDAAAATQQQLEEIQEVMAAMGDQRDLFASFDDEDAEAPTEDESQMELVET